MKTVLMVPGFRENFESRNYRLLLQTIEAKGYLTKFIPIDWTQTTIDDWIKALNQEYSKHEAANTILAGFSFGAMAAFVVASQIRPAELWIFSLSPYFAEDIHKLKKSWLNQIGKNRIEAFKRISFNRKIKLIRSKTLIFIGDLEARRHPLLLRRADTARKLIAGSKLITVPECGHDVAHPQYVEAIGKAI